MAYAYTPRRPYVASNASAAMPTVLYTRSTCSACRGEGKMARQLVPTCHHCGASWTPTRFEALMEAYDRPRWFRRNRYLWHVLPCGCDITSLVYHRAPCADCGGAGYIYQRAMRDDLRRAGMLTSDELATPRTGYPQVAYRAHVPYIPPIHTTQPLRNTAQRS